MSQDPRSFELVREDVRTDERGRLTVGREFAGKKFRVLHNDSGQNLLDPVLSIPEREMWLWRNPEARRAVARGLAELSRGERVDLGSFASQVERESDG